MSLFQKRLLMSLAGTFLCGFSVGMFQVSSMGMDPFQVFSHGIWNQCQFLKAGEGIRLLTAYDPLHPIISFGTVYMILSAVLLVVVFLMDRKKIGLGTFINLFFLGYVVDLSAALWRAVFPAPALIVRILLMTAGIIIMCFGAAIYITGNLGVSTYDAFALTISERTGRPFRFLRIATDCLVTALGTLLGTFPGIGTILTAFFMGPLIDFFRRTAAEPFLR